jgi:hypothetical protein
MGGIQVDRGKTLAVGHWSLGDGRGRWSLGDGRWAFEG